MHRQSEEDDLPTSGPHGFMMRHMGHSKNKRKVPIVPILLMILVAMHIVAAISLAKTGSAFSFNNPMSYAMVGLLIVFAISKLKVVLGFLRRNRKHLVMD